MSHLAELQQRFQQCLLEPPGDMEQPWVRAGGRAVPSRQLSAYIHAYPARLKEVLANDYPALLMALGEEAFEQLAQRYLRTHPSHYFSLRDFGGRMAGFLVSEHAYREHPWMTELASFEWALGQAFDAADTAVTGIDDVEGIAPRDWPDMRCDIHPSLQRLDFNWNVTEMWSSLTAEAPMPVTAIAAIAVPWLVWREQLTTRFRSLQPDECAALDCLRADGDFGEVCEQLAGLVDPGDVPLRAASLLKGWIAQGLITGIRM